MRLLTFYIRAYNNKIYLLRYQYTKYLYGTDYSNTNYRETAYTQITTIRA